MHRKTKDRPKIAVFLDSLLSGYHQQIWKYIHREILKREISIQCYDIGVFDQGNEFLYQRNKTFEMAKFGKPDAAVVFSNLIGNSIGEEEALKRISRDLHVPLVSVGADSKGIPSVLFDSFIGINEIINHAVDHHGYRNFLIINGPPLNSDASEQEANLLLALQKFGITEDSGIAAVSWDYSDVQKSIGEILGKIKEGAKTEVVIAFDDEIAAHVNKSLEAGGIEPENRPALFGFNNLPEYIRLFPGLSTVNQPLDQLMEKSIDICLDLLDKKEVPDVTRIPTSLIVRTSCGCRQWQKDTFVRAEAGFSDLEKAVKDGIKKLFKKTMPGEWQKLSAELFYSAFYKDIVSGTNSELSAAVFLDLISETFAHDIEAVLWSDFLDSIEAFLDKSFVSTVQESRKSNLLCKMRDILNNFHDYRKADLDEKRAGIPIEQKYLGSGLLTASTYEELAISLSSRIMQLSTPSFRIFLFDDNSWPEKGNMYISGNSGTGDFFSIEYLSLSPGISYASYLEELEKKAPVLVMALYHRETVFGYMFLEAGNRDSSFYETVCSQTSAVINSLHQFAQIRRHSGELEEKVRERTRVLNRAMRELEAAYLQLKDIDQLKNDFIMNITHDFRSPLTVINNLAELSLMDEKSLSPELTENFELILTSGIQLKKYIDQLLELSRIDARGIKLSISGIQMNSFLQKLAAFYKSSVSGSNIRIECELPEQEVYIHSDSVKLEDIKHNVVSNAVKFVDNNKGLIVIRLVEDGNKVVVSVKDNGIGVEKEHLDLIFRRFEKIEKSTDTVKQRSTGIGLAYAAQLAGFMGGKIWAESEGLNEGSEFFIEIPKGSEHLVKELMDFNRREVEMNKEIKKILQYDIRQKDNAAKDQKVVLLENRNKTGEFDFKKAAIMIVEDDIHIRKIVHEYLGRAGYENFLLASNGKEAIELFDKFRPDMVISDLNMPVMKGDELYDAVRKKKNSRDIPFIFLSAVGDQKLSFGQGEKGLLTYLKKPIDREEFLIVVNQQLIRFFSQLRGNK